MGGGDTLGFSLPGQKLLLSLEIMLLGGGITWDHLPSRKSGLISYLTIFEVMLLKVLTHSDSEIILYTFSD